MKAFAASPSQAARRVPSETVETNGRLLTADDLAERWQVGVAHVYRLTRERALPAVKLGRYYRYRLDAIEAFEAGGGVAADA